MFILWINFKNAHGQAWFRQGQNNDRPKLKQKTRTTQISTIFIQLHKTSQTHHHPRLKHQDISAPWSCTDLSAIPDTVVPWEFPSWLHRCEALSLEIHGMALECWMIHHRNNQCSASIFNHWIEQMKWKKQLSLNQLFKMIASGIVAHYKISGIYCSPFWLRSTKKCRLPWILHIRLVGLLQLKIWYKFHQRTSNQDIQI